MPDNEQSAKPLLNEHKNDEDVNVDVELLQPWLGYDIDKIVSIDFGSFGFAASFCPVGVPSHLRIIQDWADQRAATELNKNLAALLIDKETKQTIAMGFEAEEMYMRAQEKKEDDRYMYFAHFKPYLYSRDHLEKNIPVPAADGTSTLPLADLITKSLEAVMQHSLNYINGLNQLAGIDDTNAARIFWVISVPAIWDEMSKEMMKSCARQAGMRHFELGSEPVVSTFYVLNSQGKEFKLRERDKVMILDCGGGTIDAACIEIDSADYDLSELHYGDGIRAGGLDVDRAFEALLPQLLPTDVVERVRDTQPAQWMRQRNEFVLAKFSVPLDLDDSWNVPFCFALNSVLTRHRRQDRKLGKYTEIKTAIQDFEIADLDVDLDLDGDVEDADAKANDDDDDDDDDDKQKQKQKQKMVKGAFSLGRANLKVRKAGWLYLHEEVLVKICAFVRRLFGHAEVQQCSKVVLVGGFANSKILTSRLLAEFPHKQFLTPKQPHLAVVRGALFWICQRRKMKKTRARLSYGLAIDRKFRPDIDPPRRRRPGDIVENAFNVLVHRNEEYLEGYKQTFEYWIPAGADKLELFLYASEEQYPQFVFAENPEQEAVFDTLESKPGARCWPVKQYVIRIAQVQPEKRAFKLHLEYKQNGINLSYIDPDTQVEKKVAINTTNGTH